MEEAVYALDESGVVHAWYPTTPSLRTVIYTGLSGCGGVPRESIVRFMVVAEPTCIACIATMNEPGLDAKPSLEQLLRASVKYHQTTNGFVNITRRRRS